MTAGAWCVLFLVTALAQTQEPRHKETIDVSRVLVDVRVIRGGQAVLDLGAEDFEVKIDGRRARVDSVQWLGGTQAESTSVATEVRTDTTGTLRGRLIVFLVQKDFEGSRMTGLMRAMIETPAFLSAFSPEDRFAVLSFDKHLKVWLDFTNDIERVRHVLQHGVLVERPAGLNQALSHSLVDRLPESLAKTTYTIEDALAVLGRALSPLPGSKTVVMLGYGFGRLSVGGGFARVTLDPGYDRARQALQEARASVFCLDITNADYHSLEVGLQSVAEDTGGFFVRTHIFTKRAFQQVAAALAGHYVLFVEKPDLRPGSHRIQVKLVRRAGEVMAKNSYTD